MTEVKEFLEAELRRERAAYEGTAGEGPQAEAVRQPALNRVAVLDWLLRSYDQEPMNADAFEAILGELAAGDLAALGVRGVRGDFLGLSRDEGAALLARWHARHP